MECDHAGSEGVPRSNHFVGFDEVHGKSPIPKLGAPWDHEPCNWSAGLRPSAVRIAAILNAPGRRPALRFRESLHDFEIAHGSHEPCSRPCELAETGPPGGSPPFHHGGYERQGSWRASSDNNAADCGGRLLKRWRGRNSQDTIIPAQSLKQMPCYRRNPAKLEQELSATTR
jgi:hypothetical protein